MVTGIQADVFRTVIPLPEHAEEKSSPKSSPKSLAKTEDRVLALIRADECITAEKMGAEIGVSKRAILKQIDKLKKQQRLERVGAAKGGHWKVLDG
jgi:ATP-dependent DNA helicase RecG